MAWGTRRFYTYYFTCGVGAGLVEVIVKTIIDPHGVGTSTIPTIGASGAIYGILLAAAIVFLASDEAGYITGHVLDVNGGMYLA